MMRPAPVPASARIETLDVLRGFALLGILAMNIRAMAAPFGTYMYPYALFDYTGVNRAAFIFTSTAVDLKMMGLFSMLSGRRAAVRGQVDRGRPAAARALVQADVLAARDRSRALVPDLGGGHSRAVCALRHPPALVGAPPAGEGTGRGRRWTPRHRRVADDRPWRGVGRHAGGAARAGSRDGDR